MLKRLRPILEEKRIIPDHQFEFRQQNSTATQQVHRITEIIRGILEGKRIQYCSAGLLNVKQAFAKAWHQGLLFTIRKNPSPYTIQNIRIMLKRRLFKWHQRQNHKYMRNRYRCIAGKYLRTRPISYLHKWPSDIGQDNNCYLCRWYSNIGNTWRTRDSFSEISTRQWS